MLFTYPSLFSVRRFSSAVCLLIPLIMGIYAILDGTAGQDFVFRIFSGFFLFYA